MSEPRAAQTFWPSPRRLDILSAWWRTGMSNVAAGELLNLSAQVIRNELLILRRGAGAKDNVALVRRYRNELMNRNVLKGVVLNDPNNGSPTGSSVSSLAVGQRQGCGRVPRDQPEHGQEWPVRTETSPGGRGHHASQLHPSARSNGDGGTRDNPDHITGRPSAFAEAVTTNGVVSWERYTTESVLTASHNISFEKEDAPGHDGAELSVLSSKPRKHHITTPYRERERERSRLAMRQRRLLNPRAIQYQEMVAERGHEACGICGQLENTTSEQNKVLRLQIDHDHSNGLVRDLLCHNCNIAIGHMKDNPKLLVAAAKYIGRFAAHPTGRKWVGNKVVKPATGRAKPLDASAGLAPFSLEPSHIPLADPVGKIESPAVGESDSRPHAGMVAL